MLRARGPYLRLSWRPPRAPRLPSTAQSRARGAPGKAQHGDTERPLRVPVCPPGAPLHGPLQPG